MKLYVGNIPFETTEADLRVFFDPTPLLRATVCKDRETGKPKGFAFVEIADLIQAQIAMAALNGASLGGRKVVVSEAVEKRSGRSDNRL